MPRRSPSSIIAPSVAAAALAVALAGPADAQSSVSARIGVRAVIAPLVSGPTTNELADPIASSATLGAAREGTATGSTATGSTAIGETATRRTGAAGALAPVQAPGMGVPAATPAAQGSTRVDGAEPRRYRAVVRLDGVDGTASVPLRVRDAGGRMRDLAREAAVLVSDAPAVEVRRALARLLASTAQRSPRTASSASTDDPRAGAVAGSTIRLTLELTPSTMLTQ